MNRKYRALLEHGRTDSRRHPPMPNRERAAQFAPFSALNGYEDAVAETARLTEAQTELSESAAEELDEKLRSAPGAVENPLPLNEQKAASARRMRM